VLHVDLKEDEKISFDSRKKDKPAAFFLHTLNSLALLRQILECLLELIASSIYQHNYKTATHRLRMTTGHLYSACAVPEISDPSPGVLGPPPSFETETENRVRQDEYDVTKRAY